MVMLIDGLDRLRDLLEDDVFKCQAGTGTTAPTEADTSLETPDSNTLLAPTVITLPEQAIQITHTISAGTGTGNAYSEQETQLNSGTDHLNRIVHTALTKGAKDQYEYITTVFFTSV